MDNKKNKKPHFNKKWLLLAALPLMAAAWKLSDDYTAGYYHRPLSISPELAANFGEIRENHFHMGLDIRTNGKENLPVYAAADGYISKVTIEEAGFGKALYVTHPNGTITVYAHLNHFMDALEKYVHENQYHSECWQQDLNLSANQFIVTKGQRIAYSGNTGTSEGPHLHFEIRDAHTGSNTNPLVSGLAIGDHVKPTIRSLYWYNKTSSIYATPAVQATINGDDGNYTTAQQLISVNSPHIAFGIDAIDKNAASKYRLGIYSAKLYMDESLVFGFALNTISYADTRYVNAGIDYANWITHSKCIQLLCRLPGNQLPAYNTVHGNGVLNLSDKKPHKIKIVISDAAGNKSILNTMVKYDGSPAKTNTLAKDGQRLLPGKANYAESPNAKLEFSSKALYDTALLRMSEEKGKERNTASPAILLHDATIPVHDSFLVQVKTTLAVSDPLRAHTIMQLTNEKHSILIRGKWKGNYMAGWFMELGTVQLIIDTVAPAVSMQEGNNTSFTANDKALHILYRDNGGEASFFRAELDGRWILFEKKGDRFTYNFDDHCTPGRHKLNVIAGDKAGNITQQVFMFNRQ